MVVSVVPALVIVGTIDESPEYERNCFMKEKNYSVNLTIYSGTTKI